MPKIKLTREWELGPQFATGGFGRIHEATADDGSAAVLKLVPKAPGADRELLFEELSGHPNIVPIIDSGEWEDFHVLVMPRADKSLRRHLQDSGGRLPVDEAVEVLGDIAKALASMEANVVHRDLKPENILLYNGRWCVADFGIARYAEATTAPDTHKFSMTPAYAAPEQWRGERATNATDIYAFGVMAFELLQGRLPFSGHDFRNEHLGDAPPPMADVPPALASLVDECLTKAAAARPIAANVLNRLRSSQSVPSPAAVKLQEANRAVTAKRGQEAAKLSAEQARLQSRGELFRAASDSFDRVTALLEERVLEFAPATRISRAGINTAFRLGDGVLIVDNVQTAPIDCLAAFDYEPTFDVVAYSAICARKPRDRHDYEGRAHSLWFCDAHEEGVYRWYELAFMVLPSIPERSTVNPFALDPQDEYAGRAFVPVMDVRQLAWQPVPFDQGDEGPFIERWLGWFAEAADGSIAHPRYMPEESGGRHRPARQARARTSL